MLNVTKKMAPIKHQYGEDNETFSQRIIPEMVSKLRSELIFGDDTAKSTKKMAGSNQSRTPTNIEMQNPGNLM